MSELPFGDNPFDTEDVAPPSHPEPRPTPSNLRVPPPPPPHFKKPADRNNKRGGEAETARAAASKKQRCSEKQAVDPVASSFGLLASANYGGDDVKHWSGRTVAEAEFSFKMGLGETFFHGLQVLNAKNAQIEDLSKSADKYKGLASSLKSKNLELQKRKDEELRSKQETIDALQIAFDALSLESKQAAEDLALVIQSLKAELANVRADVWKECSLAYSQGFLGYLRALSTFQASA